MSESAIIGWKGRIAHSKEAFLVQAEPDPQRRSDKPIENDITTPQSIGQAQYDEIADYELDNIDRNDFNDLQTRFALQCFQTDLIRRLRGHSSNTNETKCITISQSESNPAYDAGSSSKERPEEDYLQKAFEHIEFMVSPSSSTYCET